MENKILEEIDNIEQLSANMRFKVNNNNLDLDVELESIENWVKNIKKKLKKINKIEVDKEQD